jgi:hypothetical protein
VQLNPEGLSGGFQMRCETKDVRYGAVPGWLSLILSRQHVKNVNVNVNGRVYCLAV